MKRRQSLIVMTTPAKESSSSILASPYAEGVRKFQPRVRAQREPWEIVFNLRSTLKGLDDWRTLSGFNDHLCSAPRVVAALQPWAEIGGRLQRIHVFELTQPLLMIT